MSKHRGSELHRCSGTCGRNEGGRWLLGAHRRNACQDRDGRWWCARCRSLGKPEGRQRTTGEAVMAAATPTIPLHAPDAPHVLHAPNTSDASDAPTAVAFREAPTLQQQPQSHSDSDSSVGLLSFVASLENLSPLHRRDSSIAFYDRYHYVLLPTSDRSSSLASDLEKAKLDDAALTIPIAGRVKQLDLGALAAKLGMAQELLARMIALAVETAHHYTRVPTERLQIRTIKLLTAQRGKGEQMIHCDHLSGFECRGRYSFLLYASDGAPSTAMWMHPHGNLPNLNSDDSMRDAALYARVWSKTEYHHIAAVDRGQMMFFDESMPHYGVKNTGKKPRRVVFVQLADEAIPSADLVGADDEADTDEYQFYEWQHVDLAWGTDSLQFAQALINNKAHDPLQHKFSLEAVEEALKTLQRHEGKFEEYFGSKVEPAWINRRRAAEGQATVVATGPTAEEADRENTEHPRKKRKRIHQAGSLDASSR